MTTTPTEEALRVVGKVPDCVEYYVAPCVNEPEWHSVWRRFNTPYGVAGAQFIGGINEVCAANMCDLLNFVRTTLPQLVAEVEAARNEAAAALEAAREDACVALVADIRFACGDNGKRMQPELVEFIRGLARDAERYRFIAADHSAAWEEELDAAIDQARGKEDGNG